MEILIGVFIALIIYLIVLFTIKSDSKIILYAKYTVIVLLVIDTIMIGYFITKSKGYDEYYKEYEKLKSTDEWKDSQKILNMTKVIKKEKDKDGKDKIIYFPDNKDAQKEMYKECYDYTNKYYDENISGNFKNAPVDNDYYAPTIECSNLAKTKQNDSTNMLNKAHDTCINALRKKNNAEYTKHMNNIMNSTYASVIRDKNKDDPTYTDKTDKEILYEDCANKMEDI